VEILAPGATPELSDVPIFSGEPTTAWSVLEPGEYLGTGALAAGTDAEWLEDVVVTVTDTESTVQWARHRFDNEGSKDPRVCRCGAAWAPSVIHFG
jgi:hypothetical protein